MLERQDMKDKVKEKERYSKLFTIKLRLSELEKLEKIAQKKGLTKSGIIHNWIAKEKL